MITTNERVTFRLLCYITEYTRENKIPPTTNLMVREVKGITGKSSLYKHLGILTKRGDLTRRGEYKCYYPTSLEKNEIFVPKKLVNETMAVLKDIGCEKLYSELKLYV